MIALSGFDPNYAHLVASALELVGAVHDADLDRINAWTRNHTKDLPQVAAVLAAMVPQNRTPRQLLAWTDYLAPELVRGESMRKPHVDGNKHCAYCKTWKPLAAYPSDRSRWDGLSARCRQCNNARRKTPQEAS